MNLPFLVDLSTIYFLQGSLKNNLQADYHDPKSKNNQTARIADILALQLGKL